MNPRLKLDNGEVVWGCECWWGSEAKIKDMVEKWVAAGLTIKDAKMSEIRKQVSKGWGTE